jgi:large subunit ribosomal protein L11
MTTLIKNKLNIKSGSKLPHKEKIAHLTLEQMKEIANEKMPDLNAIDLAGALMSVRGSARSA